MPFAMPVGYAPGPMLPKQLRIGRFEDRRSVRHGLPPHVRTMEDDDILDDTQERLVVLSLLICSTRRGYGCIAVHWHFEVVGLAQLQL